MIVIVLMLLIAFPLALLKGIKLIQIIPLFLVLLLTVVPVALPTMFTITLALGSRRLVKKNVLITRLNALDDAASMDVLCADKTGTLTMNKLSITNIIPLGKYNENEVIQFGALASEAANKDPIDIAFIEAAEKNHLLPGNLTRTKFIPFDPTNRRTEVYLKNEKQEIKVLKGAFKIILSL